MEHRTWTWNMDMDMAGYLTRHTLKRYTAPRCMLSPSQPYLLYYQSTKPPVSGSSAAGLVGTWSVLVLGLVVRVRARVRARARVGCGRHRPWHVRPRDGGWIGEAEALRLGRQIDRLEMGRDGWKD